MVCAVEQGQQLKAQNLRCFSNGQKNFCTRLFKKALKGTTFGGNIDLYDDPDVSVPKAKFKYKKRRNNYFRWSSKSLFKKTKR